MLKEFAFTPQVFDPNAAPDRTQWREYIRTIATSLFRAPPVPPIVVSGLYWNGDDCAWRRITLRLIESIPDAAMRRDAQELFTQVKKHLVPRLAGPDWPGDEEPGWGAEAAHSHRLEPLDRIVAQRVDHVPHDVPRAALSSVTNSAFWNLMHEERPRATSAAEAIRPLHLVLRHSELIVMSMPYEKCEEFTFECIRRACKRPATATPPVIHVHRQAPAKPEAKAAWVRSQLAGQLRGAKLHYYFWPEPYRERVILGCRMADLGGGQQKPSARWGVSLTHVWGEGESMSKPPDHQAMMPISTATEHLRWLQDESAASNIKPVTI